MICMFVLNGQFVLLSPHVFFATTLTNAEIAFADISDQSRHGFVS
jgi:hypothetical protein